MAFFIPIQHGSCLFTQVIKRRIIKALHHEILNNHAMKFSVIIFTLLMNTGSLFAQTTADPAISKPVTYALIVGISTYDSKGIKSLKYADRDARIFASYLKSAAGGNVKEDNIRLLINEAATSIAVYDAMYWLMRTCNKDDLVYFYFAGHGDMENTTFHKLGFLLSYNSPSTNYINNAIRIEDLNNFANTLSISRKAKVLLITDACRSGNLAGKDYRGTFLVADQLRAVKYNEIRITACGPDQLSNEDDGWGGGRGIFSYYLVNGLTGLADSKKDGYVSMQELRMYLDSSFTGDTILKENNLQQDPVLKGDNGFIISKVNDSALSNLKKDLKNQSKLLVQSATLPPQPQDYFFYRLKEDQSESNIDFNKLEKMSKKEIPFECIKQLMPDGMPELESKLKNDPVFLQRFNEKLVDELHKKAQTNINLYLAGDAAELERRRYYNSQNNGYDIYPKMLAVALKLTDPVTYTYRLIKINMHYFKAIAARLKIPVVADPKPLWDLAMKELTKAYQLEENAANIQNELGILFMQKKKYTTAEKHFLLATEISPNWALPWSNLINVYTATNEFEKGMKAAEKASQIQPDFQGTYINRGYLYEKKGDLLHAEELYRKSIRLNSRHYIPFERLGYVYMATTQYALADSFFNEAAIRKKGYHFREPDIKLLKPIALADDLSTNMCFVDTMDIQKNEIMGYFHWAMISDPFLEEEYLKKMIALDRTNPLAFHYLGKFLFEQDRLQEADIIFNLAATYHLSEDDFKRYADSLGNLLPESKSKSCIINNFKKAYYNKMEDLYFLANMYERWNHFEEAEKMYLRIIQMQPTFIGSYYKLWNLLEKTGRYDDAEDVIRSFTFIDNKTGNNELNDFNKRMIRRFPEDWYKYYKAGKLLYTLALNDRNGITFSLDQKEIKADEDEESFVNENQLKNSKIKSVASITLPGTDETFNLSTDILLPGTEGIGFLIKADSLLLYDENTLADINNKIADLYVWQGLPEMANKHYQKSVNLKPDNANTRLKLVDTYAETYHLSSALLQLDSLFKRREINYPKQVLLAKYDIHSGRFKEAELLIKDAENIHPYYNDELTDLSGRLNLFTRNQEKAISFYKKYLETNKEDFQTMYTIALLYAQKGKNKDARDWLKNAMAKGFRYSYVLQFDDNWNKIRKTGKWKTLINSYPLKKYDEIIN